jgi:hypothetical protein
VSKTQQIVGAAHPLLNYFVCCDTEGDGDGKKDGGGDREEDGERG